MKWIKWLGTVTLILVLIAGIAFFGRHELFRMQEGLPSFTDRAGDDFAVMVAMEDGTRLHTTVQLPAGDGPVPGILIRNPYAAFGKVMRDTLCGRFVRYGYACIFQDTRGQGLSEGEWAPGTYEMVDGRDTLKWLVEQPFQNGNLAMMGPSYLAAVQWAAASAGLPPEVKTIIPAVYTTDSRKVMYQDGMFRHETFTAWASLMRSSNSENDSAGKDYQKAIRYRPHKDVDVEVFGIAMPWYQDMIHAASPSSAFWQTKDNVALRTTPEQMTIPVLMIGGWYDVFFGPQFDDWQRLATRSESRFVIGPWTHGGTSGEALETPNAGGGLFQWAEMLPWLEKHLKGKDISINPGLKIYDMHENVWEEYDEWPMQGEPVIYQLARLPSSNACQGGLLAEMTTADRLESVSFEYDPDNPVPTKGGAGMLAFLLPGFDGAPPANVLQDGLCERDDVLTFTTDLATDKPITITGKIKVHLVASSTAEDTSFTAKLIEVTADSKAINIRDAITSLAYRNGNATSQSYVPGERVELDFDFWPIQWTVQPGSRIRLDISSSDFPKFNAHTNRAGNWADIETPLTATQTIYSGSTLELSVVND